MAGVLRRAVFPFGRSELAHARMSHLRAEVINSPQFRGVDGHANIQEYGELAISRKSAMLLPN